MAREEIIKKNVLTHKGLKNFEDELEMLKTVKRKEIAKKLAEAKEQGDLSENAEYDAARQEQQDNERRIEEIEEILKNAEVVTEEDVDLKKVGIGCKVVIKDLTYDDEMEFNVVGTKQACSTRGSISNESPVGKAIEGHKVGDTVKVETPSGIIKYKILKIERSTD
ncbi:MAG: transcription elongation factor GreA [Lachnospiraceae bacterium]|nr:transcription elongation factor GreA [Lachnospiraceae bacterium]